MNNQFSFTIFVLPPPPGPSKGASPPPLLRRSETISCNRGSSGSIPQKLSFDLHPQPGEARALAIFVGSPVVKSFRPRAQSEGNCTLQARSISVPSRRTGFLSEGANQHHGSWYYSTVCEESFQQQEKLFRCRLVTCHLNHALPLCQYLPTKIPEVGGVGESELQLVGVFCSFTLARNDKSQWLSFCRCDVPRLPPASDEQHWNRWTGANRSFSPQGSPNM